MTELDDGALIQKYRAGSQHAFAELAKRYVNLIYASALRQTRDPASADDVTQAVLIVLARKADSVRPGDLPGWLMRTTWYAARDLLKRQRRAQTRDRMGFCATHETPSVVDAAIESEVLAILDESLAKLRPAERNALTLRFLRNKSFAAVGAALGTTDEGARRRTSRALQRLRGMLDKRGVSVPAAAVPAVLATAAAPVAPAHVLATAPAAAHVVAPGDMAGMIAQAVMRTRLIAPAKLTGTLLLVSIAVVGALLAMQASRTSVPEASAQAAPLGELPPLSPDEITLVGLRADGDDVLLDTSANAIGRPTNWHR